MAKFIINRNPQPSGEHEVHEETICTNLPYPENRITVGDFNQCSTAILAAKTRWPGYIIDGCEYCTACHTR